MAPSAVENTNMKYPNIPIKQQNKNMASSGGIIEAGSIGCLRPTDPSIPMDEIRKRYSEDGYVWLKGLLPPADVWNARKEYFDFLGPTGLVKQGSEPRDGVFCGGDWRLWMAPGKLRDRLGLRENKEYDKRVTEAHAAPWYMSFANHPTLKEFTKKFANWDDTTLLKRSLFRPNVPGGESTLVHYDQIFLRGGPPTALTAWVPHGDIAVNGGGLLYLEDSASVGQEIEKGFTEAAKDFTEEERVSAFNAHMMEGGFLEKDSGKFSKLWGRKWLAADYEAGDVVLHDAFNIHCSAVNETVIIRLATDLRFVETGKPFDERWMKYWEPDDGL